MAALPSPEYWKTLRDTHFKLVDHPDTQGLHLLSKGWATEEGNIVKWIGTRIGGVALGQVEVVEFPEKLGPSMLDTMFRFAILGPNTGLLAVHQVLDTDSEEPRFAAPPDSLAGVTGWARMFIDEAKLLAGEIREGAEEFRMSISPTPEQYDTLASTLQYGLTAE